MIFEFMINMIILITFKLLYKPFWGQFCEEFWVKGESWNYRTSARGAYTRCELAPSVSADIFRRVSYLSWHLVLLGIKDIFERQANYKGQEYCPKNEQKRFQA